MNKLVFCLCAKVVALNLGTGITKGYLHNQGCIVSLSTLTFYILNLANKHDLTHILAYIPKHLNVEADYLSLERLVLEWHLLHVAQAVLHLLVQKDVELLTS